MDLPTPLKTLALRAFALRARAFSPLTLALTFALAFSTTFSTGWLLLNRVPIVVLLLTLLLLQLLRRRLLPRSSLAVVLLLVHHHRRQRADQGHSEQRRVSARARSVKAVLMLLAQVYHELARARVWW